MKRYLFATVMATTIATPAVAAQCFHSNGTCYAVTGSAYVSSSGSQSGFTYYDSQVSGHAEQAGFGSHAVSDVSLTDAAIRLLADGHGMIGTNGDNAASANGHYFESIRFDLPEGVTSIRVPVRVRLEGINTATGPGSRFGGYLGFQMASYGNSVHFDSFSVTKNCGFDADFTQAICRSGSVSIEYSGELTIYEDVYYGIDYTVTVSAFRGISDFQHTAHLSWDLPQGVSFISGSGTFMSASATAVPEPATWATLLVGFGVIGGSLRRRGGQAISSAA